MPARSGGRSNPLTLTLNFSRGRWSASWLMTLLTLVVVVCFVQLGRWQWHRAQGKRELAAAFNAGNAAASELGARSTAALPRYTQVRVHGRYDAEHQFLLDNMSHDGAPGYQVLTPLHIDDGRVLLVNRGWVPLTRSRHELPSVAIDGDASATPTGKLDALPVPGIALGRLPPAPDAPWPQLTSFPLVSDLSAALGVPLEAQQLLLNPDQPHGYLRDWHVGGIGPERHVAYAVQWWGFAALALGLYVRLNWHRT
jgi:surfeit locus 1 family protein